ncbi:MAG TPA: fumarylacetoacetate hydrolase family protein [Candidatus Bathyarchaeia archaeon]|nr:fumarylacetoacetate hydrolase family protein [Candidatus Bathyarchaeia archaeon]
MKIARYCYRNEESYGVINQRTVLSLPALAKRFKKEVPQKIEDFIAQGKKTIETTEDLIKKASGNDVEIFSAPLNAVTLLAPIAFPPKIICLGLNYFDHAAETDSAIPDEPIIFMKPHTTIIGPNENILKPSFVKKLDYEGELAIVMGKKAKNIPVSEAKEYIFGYTILNDVSARDFQFKDGQWTRGKSFDTFAPTGPCITTTNQLRDTDNLAVRTWVNGELRQNSTTRNMAFNVSEIVHHLSRVMTLEPCDVIATGTPSGVGFAMKPPKFLQHGDVIRIEIEGIGVLENTVEEK